jgi:putative hemolysin
MNLMDGEFALPLTFKTFFLVACIIMNGYFSMAEMALIKARKGRLQRLAEHGSRGAKHAVYLIENPGKLLATVQVGMTISSTLAGAFGASQFSAPLSEFMSKMGLAHEYSLPFSFMILVLLISYLTLVFGELAPKKLALFSPERTAVFVSPGMRLLARTATPLVALLSLSSEMFLRLLAFKKTQDPEITEEEIYEALEVGVEAGLIERFEHRIVNQVFRLGDRPITSLMTPRLKMESIPLNSSDANLRTFFAAAKHVSYPVYDGSPDNIIGVIHTQEVLKIFLQKSEIDLKRWLKEPLIIPEGETSLNALRLFQRKKVHMGVVVDEYGGVKGIVTLRDFLRSILGEVKPVSKYETPFRRRSDGSWVVSGSVPIETIQEKIGLIIREDKKSYFKTLAGFVLHVLGKIPKEGDSFIYKEYKFEVIDMDGKRIDKVLISHRRKRTRPGLKS